MIWRAWDAYWFRRVRPHQFALLRIVFGLVALTTLTGLSDIDAFWRLDGLVSPDGSRLQNTAVALFGGDVAPLVVLGFSITAYVLMTLGVASPVTVPLAFLVALAQLSWNRLPLSGAYQTQLNLLFCLAFADCGRVWSVDAWWRRRHGRRAEGDVAIWPLRLLRFQVCLMYFVTGWWKFQNVHWRDGSALHYVMSNVQFRRFPVDPPIWSAPLLTFGTYLTLFWELLFPMLVLWRPTRWLALAIGILLHTGMWLTIEIGTFPLVMIASYVAFLEPETVPRLAASVRARLEATPSATSTLP